MISSRDVRRCTRRVGLPSGSARALQLLGIARLILGDLPAARAALEQGLPVIVNIGDRFAIPSGLTGTAGLAAKSGRPRLALKLAGAAAAYEEVNQTHLPDPLRGLLDEWLAPVRVEVGAAAAKLFVEGRRMTLDDAVAQALADEPEDPWRVGPGTSLTRRESEVASLVARGLTNRDIAGSAVHLDQDRRGPRRSDPVEAGLSNPHTACGMGARGRSSAAKYVVGT